MILLSQHFTLHEFIVSDVAKRKNINNTPPQKVIEELKRLAQVMEDVRALLCQPIYITSGYRCSALNKLIGSKPSSAHVQGLACDFKSIAFGYPVDICNAIAESDIQFDQLILEYNSWVHLGLGSKNRRQVLTINEHGIYSGVKP